MASHLLPLFEGRAFWRINFQPTLLPRDELSMLRCSEVVEKGRVQFRGWDYPHFQRNESHGHALPSGQYFESSTHWGRHLEFWRMYRSSQFLHYVALWEDSEQGEERVRARLPPAPVLDAVGAVYQTTEIFEFLARLVAQGLYESGVIVSVSLRNIKNYRLWVDPADRLSFYEDKKTLADKIVFKKRLSSTDAKDKSAAIARAAAIYVFDAFGWNPSPDLVERDQMKLLSRTLRR